MAKTWDPEAPYRKGTTVRLINDLPGIPEGTEGKVRQANGFRWKRYWVRFDGDREMVGQISHDQLVPVKHWDTYLANQEAAARAAEEAAARAASATSAAGNSSGGGPAAAGGGAVINGVAIPPHLLERSAAARQRLGG